MIQNAIQHQTNKRCLEVTENGKEREMLQIALMTNLTMGELDEMGFSMNPSSDNGWIYHGQISDTPLDINTSNNSDIELDLSDSDNDDIIDAITNKLDDYDDTEKLEFVTSLLLNIRP